ncbi:hypothetical protein GCM10025734_41590 [Kitasatospora paranensis]
MILRARRTIARWLSGFLDFTAGFAVAPAGALVAVFRALLSAMHEGYAEQITAWPLSVAAPTLRSRSHRRPPPLRLPGTAPA